MSSDLIERLRSADALVIGPNGRGGSKITLDFEKPEPAYEAFSVISDACCNDTAEIDRLTARKVVGPSLEAIARIVADRSFLSDETLADRIAALLETKAVEGEGKE